jgi:hypothetical protein
MFDTRTALHRYHKATAGEIEFFDSLCQERTKRTLPS